ncbi:MAG: methionyl-tRNA formyltransferase [Eubacterium sp.]|nr:methionyl-tRNA formyltransferase [Eubacterium sp.]
MRVVYMGTPEFASLPLRKIYEAGHQVVGVYTQPDKEKGRGKKLIASDVKKTALELELDVYQPEKLRAEDSVSQLKQLCPDIIVVAAYGQILSEEVLNIPKYGCINIHASLLPKYRGASPIESSIIDGEEETGVTIMYMAKGLDTGDIISQASTPIGKHTTESLTKELSVMGADLVVKTMTDIENGSANRIPQNDRESTYAGKLTKEMGHISFDQPAEKIERLIRGLYPWPCAFTSLDGKSMKLLGADIVELDESDKTEAGEAISSAEPGTIVEVTKKFFVVKCLDKGLKITKLQPEGKKAMDTVAFLNGYLVKVGQKLG